MDFGQVTRSATPGLGRLAMALGGGGNSFEQGRQGEMLFQSKVAQAMASAQADQAKAEQTNAETAARRPENLRRNAMTINSIPLDEDGAVESFLQSGSLGPKYDLPSSVAGPTAPRPEWADRLGKVAQMLGLTQNAIGMGDKNSSNIADSMGKMQDQGIVESAVAAATRGDNEGMSRLNTIRGKKEYTPFAAVGNSGTALNQVTGAQPVTNQPMFKLFNDEGEAKVGAQKANAVQSYAAAGASKASAANSYASADHHRASTDKTRQDIDIGGKGVLQQTDQGLLLVDPRTGASRPVLGPDGKVAGKAGLKDGKPLPPAAAKGYLENQENLRRAERALSLLQGNNSGDPANGGAQGDKSATGVKGYLPNTLLNYADPKGVDVRAAIADLGSMVINDRSGAAVSAAEFPRLQPFIPSARDDAVTAQKKLRLFVQNYKALVDDSAEFYKASGFNVPNLTPKDAPGAAAPAGGAPTPIKSDADYNALPSGAEFIAPDGSRRRKP